MKYLLLSTSLSIILLAGCREKKGNHGFERFDLSAFAQTVQLEGELLPIEIFQNINNIYFKDSLIVASTYESRKFIDIYDPVRGELVNSTVNFGRGPNELLGLQDLDFTQDRVVMLDPNQGKVMICDYRNLLDPYNTGLHRSFTIREMASHILMVDDNTMVTTSVIPAKRFAVFDGNGDRIMTKGDYPLSSTNKISDEGLDFILSEINMCAITKSPDGSIYVVYLMADLLEKYDSDLELIRRVHGPLGFVPDIGEFSDGQIISIKPGDNNRSGYFVPRIVGDELWVLYSGVLWSDKKDEGLIDTIHVFDLDLNPKRIYKLDIPVFTFDVDVPNGVMYAVTFQESLFRFVKFEVGPC